MIHSTLHTLSRGGIGGGAGDDIATYNRGSLTTDNINNNNNLHLQQKQKSGTKRVAIMPSTTACEVKKPCVFVLPNCVYCPAMIVLYVATTAILVYIQAIQG